MHYILKPKIIYFVIDFFLIDHIPRVVNRKENYIFQIIAVSTSTHREQFILISSALLFLCSPLCVLLAKNGRELLGIFVLTV